MDMAEYVKRKGRDDVYTIRGAASTYQSKMYLPRPILGLDSTRKAK